MKPCRTSFSSTSKPLLRLPARVMLLVLFLITGASGLHAQFDAGAVLGTIKDPSGSNIAAATVQLLSLSKGLKVVRQTDGNGDYEFDSVQAREYTLTVSAPAPCGSLLRMRRRTASCGPCATASQMSTGSG